MKRLLVLLAVFMLVGGVFAQDDPLPIFTDPQPDAPELAFRGGYGVGVQTVEFVNAGQVDVLALADDPEALFDRTLVTEIWYPAIIPDGEEELTEYVDSNIVEGFTFLSRSLRDAEPDLSDGPYPLIVISHGLGGSRLQLSYLADNLASKGYVVAAIDHADGPVSLQSVQTGTYFRRLDIVFVMDQIEEMNASEDSFLSGMAQTDNVGLIGYSYGGYGVLLAAGAGIAEGMVANPVVSPNGINIVNQFGEYDADPRVSAVFAFAPFGNDLVGLGAPGVSFWPAEALAAVEVPVFISVGSDDDVAYYETGSVPIFEGLTGTERYLLTILNARHNVAPNPSPPTDDLNTFFRHGEPAWRSERLNNIAQHFATAFMGLYLQGQDYESYLDLIPVASEGVPAEGDDNTQWVGFPPRTAIGMVFEYLPAGE